MTYLVSFDNPEPFTYTYRCLRNLLFLGWHGQRNSKWHHQHRCLGLKNPRDRRMETLGQILSEDLIRGILWRIIIPRLKTSERFCPRIWVRWYLGFFNPRHLCWLWEVQKVCKPVFGNLKPHNANIDFSESIKFSERFENHHMTNCSRSRFRWSVLSSSTISSFDSQQQAPQSCLNNFNYRSPQFHTTSTPHLDRISYIVIHIW